MRPSENASPSTVYGPSGPVDHSALRSRYGHERRRYRSREESGIRILLEPELPLHLDHGRADRFHPLVPAAGAWCYTFEITGSPFLVSLVPVLWGLPLTFCGPIGGIADRVNREVLLAATIAVIFGVAATLAVISAQR